MRTYFFLILFFVHFWANAQSGNPPLNLQRSPSSVIANDGNINVGKGLKVPLFPDTMTASSSIGWDSLGMIIQIRSTGAQYKRDTIIGGGHKWSPIGSITDTSHLSARINNKQADLIYLPITLYNAVADSGTTDNTLAIQSCVDSITRSAKKKGVIYIPAGVWGIAGTIHVPLGDQITFLGAGGSAGDISNTICKLVTNRTTGDVFLDSANNNNFQGFDIQNNAASPTAGAGIHMVGWFAKISQVLVSNFYYDIQLDNSLYNYLSNCTLLEAVQYSLYNNNGPQPDWGDLTVDGCIFQSGTGPIQHATVAAFYQTNSGGVKFNHCKFNGSSTGIQTCIRANFVGSANSTSDLIVSGNSFEGFSKYVMWITCPGANFSNIAFSGNQVAGFGSSGNALLFDGTSGGLHRVSISGNTFNSIDTAIQAYHVDQLKISGNSIDSPSTVSFKFVNTFCTNCSFDEWDLNNVNNNISTTATAVLDSVFNRVPKLTLATIRTYTPAYGNQHVYLQDPLRSGFFYYDSTDHSTADDTAMTLVTTGGSRWKRIIPFNYISVKWFGATGDGATNDWYSIQHAINYVIGNNSVPRDVFFPQGNYRINSPLIIANFNGTTYGQATVNLVGVANAKNDPSQLSSEIFVNQNQTFGIGIQQGKGCQIRNLLIMGSFSFPNTLNVTQVDTLTFAQWTDGVTRQNVHSPYGGIVIEPFSDSTRYASNSDMYPGLHNYCPAGMSASGSTDITIANCNVTNFVVGICITPSFQQNGEIINVDNTNIGGNKVGYSICQAQSKDCHVTRFMAWSPTHTVFDNVTYGNGGANVFPDVDGGNIAGAVKQLINSNCADFRGSVENVYAESMFKIGYSNSRTGFLFKGCDFNFYTDLPNTPYPDFFVLGNGNRFEDCQLRMYGALTGRLILNQTNNVYAGGGMNAPPVITNLDNNITNPTPRFSDILMYYSTGVLGQSIRSNSTYNPFNISLGPTLNNQASPVYPSTFDFVANSGYLMRYKIEYPGSYDRQISLGTVTLHTNRPNFSAWFIPASTADTAVLQAGDFLAAEDMHYLDQFTSNVASTYPVGIISGVSGDTVYVQNLALGIHDTTMPIFSIYYQNTNTPLTGNMAAGSNLITASQCVAGLPAVGTRLDIPQVRMGTKIVAVSNDTITLSTANTTGQSYSDYTWINGYPEVKMYSNYTLENLVSSGSLRLLVGGSYFYHLNSPASGTSYAYTNPSMGNNYSDVDYVANTIYNGDTSKHKLKYYPITATVGGQTIPMGSTAQRMNGWYAPYSLIRINTDSTGTNGIPHPEIFSGGGWHQLPLTSDGTSSIPLNQVYVGSGTGGPNSYSNFTYTNGTSTLSVPNVTATNSETVTGNLTLNGATSVFSVSPTTSGYGAFTVTPQATGPTILANPNSSASNSIQFNNSVKFTAGITSSSPVTGKTLELPATGFTAASSLVLPLAANSDDTHKAAFFANGGAGATQYDGFGINDGNINGIGTSSAQGAGILFDTRNGVAPPVRFFEHAASSATEVEAMDIQNSGNVTIGTATDVASAILQIASTTKGVLFPKLTTTQQNAISSPATGLIIYNTDSFNLCVYTGTAWREVSWTAGGGGSQTLTYTQNATNNTLSISGGNTQTFLTATHTLAGLLDSARATFIDSLKNGTKSFAITPVNGLTAIGTNGIGLGGNPLTQNTTIASAGYNLAITGLSHDSSSTYGVYAMNKDSSTMKEISWSDVSFESGGYVKGLNVQGDNAYAITNSDEVIVFNTTLTANRTITLLDPPGRARRHVRLMMTSNIFSGSFQWTITTTSGTATIYMGGTSGTSLPTNIYSVIDFYCDGTSWYGLQTTIP